MTPRRWVEAGNGGEAAARLSALHPLSPVAARLLATRAWGDGELEDFLTPSRVPWPDPARIPNLEPAARRLRQAVEGRERILVHGDYDVDGLMGTAVLVGGLRALGGQVEAFIPSRFDGGYGLSSASVAAAQRSGASLVVTTDCGTNSFEVGESLRSLGIDLVVSDHHLPAAGEQPRQLVVNPHLVKDHPDGSLCGAAVALQLLRGTAGVSGRELALEPFLRLVAIATVADVVPITPVNRRICKEGFLALETTPNPGLLLLLSRFRSGILSHHVSFHLAPRLNAAGRMEDARLVLDLLMERSPAQAAALMARLEALNRKRKVLQNSAFDEAFSQALAGGGERVAFAASSAWHRGVMGPVAARLAEALRRSAFVVAVDGDEGVGSARSWGDDDVSEVLGTAADLLERFGGHAGAAGFTVKASRLTALEERLQRAPGGEGGTEASEEFFPIALEDLQDAWAAWTLLDPFGPGNPEPFFGVSGLRPRGHRAAAGKHLIWDVALPGGDNLQVIAWNGEAEGLTGSSVAPSRTVVGRLAPQSAPGGLPFYLSVAAVL
jgi:single-stranded-DNA-specific exonuclease